MKSLLPFLLLPCTLFFSACQTGGTWTADELAQWHQSVTEGLPAHVSPLWYQGSDERYHHFLCRSMDSWVPVSVPIEQITMDDLKDYQGTSSSAPFPGYYKVDPQNGFSKLP